LLALLVAIDWHKNCFYKDTVISNNGLLTKIKEKKMLRLKTCVLGILAVIAFITVGEAMAHPSVMPKNTPGEFAVRKEASGTTAYNSFVSGHGCGHDGVVEDIQAAAMVFPSGENLVVVDDDDNNPVDEEDLFTALQPDAEGRPAHIIMSPKTGATTYWNKTKHIYGPTRPHYYYGDKTEAVVAFHFEGGKVPHDMLYSALWSAAFGKIRPDSCVKQITLQIPIAHYCKKGPGSPASADVYLGRFTTVFDSPDWTSASLGWWPWLDILNQEFDEESCGEGIVYKVSPSDEDIDAYLPIPGYLGTKKK
jgi:hypothetical protein